VQKSGKKFAACGFTLLALILLGAFLPASRSLSARIGIVSWQDGQGCLAIRTVSDLTKTRVRMVSLLGSAAVRWGRATGKTDACAGSGSDTGLRYWRVDLGAGASAADFPAIGVLNFTGAFRRNGMEVSADLDHDGRREYFRSCASVEGVHFTVWTDAPLTGELRWHQYRYLGYDATPTCTAAETRVYEK